MAQIEHVDVPAMDPRRFESVLEPDDWRDLLRLIAAGNRRLEGRVIWNLNSTSKGGGVVELLWPLLGYSRGAGIDARWVVIKGNPRFFEITKRLHNRLHGFDGDGGPLGEEEHAVYREVAAAAAREFVPLVRPQDVVILHDPQTGGMTQAVKSTGAATIWRCHVGLDTPDLLARQAWDFLRPYVLGADSYVFSRRAFAWEGLDDEKIAVIQPSIDVFSAKNIDQSPERTEAILARAGVTTDDRSAPATFTRSNGSQGVIQGRAEVDQEAPLSAHDRVVTQVSRWDRLKDPVGVLRGFAYHVAPQTDAHLLLVGPATASVADDPEGAGVLQAVRGFWADCPPDVRRRVHLVSLPMDDVEENAAMVNAIQRHSDVVVQKSLAEGFGLTVAEALWKQRAMVASRIGGIQDQIVDGESGILISDPLDLVEFGLAVRGLLADPGRAGQLGLAAQRRVRCNFLGPHHLGRYFTLIDGLIGVPTGLEPAT
jgi:trehalose synthase